ncbi:MAG TPA: hypothetical protein VKA76_09845 [Gammaproteobacteria bacterium]|nr:hypothetical protein [Gammaproteobacteria bacterium]
MAETSPLQARIKGKQSIDTTAQELAWAANVPLGRIDWQPDPELESRGVPADDYLLTLTTDAGEAQGRLSAALVERVPDSRDDELKRILDRLVDDLRRQRH